MDNVRRLVMVLWAASSLLVGTVYSQDTPSLGDLARQQRQPKKGTPGKENKTAKVITNEELRSHPAPFSAAPIPQANRTESQPSEPTSSNEARQPAEQWKAQIQAQQEQIESMQKQMDNLNESIHFAPANCVANCVQWNERQREKQEQVGQMQAQLEEQKKMLEDMQESARKQGYGSSVYDP